MARRARELETLAELMRSRYLSTAGERCLKAKARASKHRSPRRQLSAHARHARARRRLVADEPQGEARQYWREGCEPMAVMSRSRWLRSPFRETCSPTSCG